MTKSSTALVKKAIELAGSAEALADALVYSRRVVFYWQKGEKEPSPRARRDLQQFIATAEARGAK